jgi:hypothetical protein
LAFLGIPLFSDPDVSDDRMGSRCGSLGKETGPSFLLGGSLDLYSTVWTEQNDMADDTLQVSCGSLRWDDSVSFSWVVVV